MVLYVAEGDYLLFEGLAEHCPPIPRPGEHVQYDDARSVQIEGIQYRYAQGEVEVQLLA